MQEVVFDLARGVFHALETTGRQPLVFLHGFPDHPPTAGRFLTELAARGHRVLAPWLRGYVPSPRSGPFDLASLAADMRALIDRWSPDHPVDLVGHDWGAGIAYALCVTAPERIRRAVTLAVPHPVTFARQLRTAAQLRRSWYIALFQLPGSSWLARRSDFALIDGLWRRWSPAFALSPTERAELHACFTASMPAPLEYYRATRRDAVRTLRLFARPITTPVLALHGAADGCILPPTEDDRHRFVAAYARETVTDVGHFLHLEAPALIAERVSSFLQRSP